jgi:HD-GYP domain-containing protein (c-di-GMP phosphodiesterase class II)
LALELSSDGLSRHHWRTAVIATRLAEQIAIDGWQRQILIYAALLHDLGAAADWEGKRRLRNLLASPDIYNHAEAGYMLLKESPQLEILAEFVRHHHDRWDGQNPSGLAGSDIPLLSRILSLADRLEILITDDKYIFDHHKQIIDKLSKLSGTYFDPELIAALQTIAKHESFWLDLVNPDYYETIFTNDSAYGRLQFNVDDVVNIAEIFATIIDQTSRFTARHSRRVSAVAAHLAKVKGYSSEEVKMMRIAGLLHDLGKLSIPNTILESEKKLTPRDFALIKQHTYYTYRILERIDGFELIAEWAAYHHETLDGKGYPFHIPESKLRLGSRIMAVADVFVALTEERPYRQAAFRPEEARQIMQKMVDSHKLDGQIAHDLFENIAAVTM